MPIRKKPACDAHWSIELENEINRLEIEKLKLQKVCNDYIGELSYFKEMLRLGIYKTTTESERNARLRRVDMKIKEIVQIISENGSLPDISI